MKYFKSYCILVILSIAGFCFATDSVEKKENAGIITIKNENIMKYGLSSETIQDWLSIDESHPSENNGEYHYNIFNKNLYNYDENTKIHKVKKECLKIGTSKPTDVRIHIISVDTNCLKQESKKNDQSNWKLVFILREQDGQKEPTEKPGVRLVRETVGSSFASVGNDDLPILAFDEEIFYNPSRGEIYSLLHAARGSQLGSLREVEGHSFANGKKTKLTKDDPSVIDTLKKAQEAYGLLGKKLAKMHLKFMIKSSIPHKEDSIFNSKVSSKYYDYYRTLIHGDAHDYNIFVDLKTKAVTLIDLETMAHSIELKDRKCILLDIMKLCGQPIFEWGALGNMFDTLKPWFYVEVFKSFFKNYIEAYPSSERDTLIDYIVKFLEGHFSMKFDTFEHYVKFDERASEYHINRFYNPIAEYLKTLKTLK